MKMAAGGVRPAFNNAIARNRGLKQFPGRGLQKVRAVLLWFALAHYLMRAVALRQAAAQAA